MDFSQLKSMFSVDIGFAKMIFHARIKKLNILLVNLSKTADDNCSVHFITLLCPLSIDFGYKLSMFDLEVT